MPREAGRKLYRKLDDENPAELVPLRSIGLNPYCTALWTKLTTMKVMVRTAAKMTHDRTAESRRNHGAHRYRVNGECMLRVNDSASE